MELSFLVAGVPAMECKAVRDFDIAVFASLSGDSARLPTRAPAVVFGPAVESLLIADAFATLTAILLAVLFTSVEALGTLGDTLIRESAS